MALPGLSLPGLGLPSSSNLSLAAAGPPTSNLTVRTEDVEERSEWRFEVGFAQPYSVRVVAGHAEMFGSELAPNQVYDLSGRKGAILSWHGCRLEITGDAESEYLSKETEYAVEWLNVHGMLSTSGNGTSTGDGQRVLVVGPDYVGKSSLIRSLAAWGSRTGQPPITVNLDPREGLLSPPSSLSAVEVGAQVDVENGYGISPVSGPTTTMVVTPLVYHYPYQSPATKPEVFKAVVTRMALSVTSKLEENAKAKNSGFIIDTPGSLNDPRSNYDLINHIASEFSVTLILTMGSERLYNDLSKRFDASRSNEDAVTVLRVSKPEGAVELGAAYMKQLRAQQVRQYFFGTTREPLSPHSQSVSFADLSIYRAKEGSDTSSGGSTLMDDDMDDIPYATRDSTKSSGTFEPVVPTNAMTGALLAIKYCPSASDEVTIRDSAVMGFVYVADVDEGRKKVRFLAPHPQRWGGRAMVWGAWPDAVADLVT